MSGRIVCQFSCGAASSSSAKGCNKRPCAAYHCAISCKSVMSFEGVSMVSGPVFSGRNDRMESRV